MAGQLTIDTLKASTGVLATQNGMTGIAKAWINFDGNSGSGNTIRSSFNISSVTRRGTGAYTVNFSTAMSNANYSVVAAGADTTDYGTDFPAQGPSVDTFTTTSVNCATGSNTNTLANWNIICLSVFGA